MNTAAEVSSFGTEKLSKLMLKFSTPCVLSLLVSALYNIVDQIFIGNSELSTLGNAATGVVFPFFIIAQAFAWCFGDGCAAYLNICLGKKDMQSADKAIGTGVTVTLLTSLLLIAVGYPLKAPLLTLFGASENSLGMAIEYLDVILAFFPFFMLSNMMNSVIRADGSPACSMASMQVSMEPPPQEWMAICQPMRWSSMMVRVISLIQSVPSPSESGSGYTEPESGVSAPMSGWLASEPNEA